MMKKYNLHIRKMKTDYQKGTVHYSLNSIQDKINLNYLLGKTLKMTFENKISCVTCNSQITKTFFNGYCYKCFTTLAECDSCIIKPELCHYHKGTCRDPQWGEDHCMKTHYVYLANTSGLKIGITRESQVPFRWMDQGAIQAVLLYKVESRLQSGILEVAHKESLNDKTDWRKMLKNNVQYYNMEEEREEVYCKYESVLDSFVQEFGEDSLEVMEDEDSYNFQYPVLSYPDKIKNPFRLEKVKKIEGTLTGIKGQYLMFDTGLINMRAHTGYHISLDVCNQN